MTAIAQPPTDAVYAADDASAFTLLVPVLLEDDAFGTSDHIGFALTCRVTPDLSTPTPFSTTRTAIRALASEVERLRDQIAARAGLTRQEIARAMGVDRRSLSGFVTGEIRPTDTRLRALRVLAETAAWSVEEFGEHAREVLRGSDPSTSPLVLIARGATDLRPTLLATAERAGVIRQNSIDTRVRTTKEPLYLRASGAWEGKGNLPVRAGVPRLDADYEQDLSKAAPTAEPSARVRREAI